MPPDTVEALLQEAAQSFRRAGIDQPKLDARLLLQHASGMSHAEVLGYPDRMLSADQAAAFRKMVTERLGHEPVSRILGWREFYGRRFAISPAVLDPRPDTETLIEEALSRMKGACRLLDLGTGSGAIAVTLLAENDRAHGVAVDLSRDALEIARRNAEILGVSDRLAFRQGSWFEPVEGRFDLILSNPPYIAPDEIEGLAPEVRNFDPMAALLGGADGLEAYRAIAADAARYLRPEGKVILEIGHLQAKSVEAIFAERGFQLLALRRDLGDRPRCLSFAALTV